MDLYKINNQPCLIVCNGNLFFSTDERKEIETKLENEKIHFLCFEKRGYYNSFLSGIEVIINDPLANLLIGGIIMPFVYDYLKKTIQLAIKRIRNGKVRTITRTSSTIPNVILKIPTEKGEIIASIDKELTDDETEAYLKALIEAAKSIRKEDQYNSIYRIIDNLSDGSLEILTLNEYLKKHKKIN